MIDRQAQRLDLPLPCWSCISAFLLDALSFVHRHATPSLCWPQLPSTSHTASLMIPHLNWQVKPSMDPRRRYVETRRQSITTRLLSPPSSPPEACACEAFPWTREIGNGKQTIWRDDCRGGVYWWCLRWITVAFPWSRCACTFIKYQE